MSLATAKFWHALLRLWNTSTAAEGDRPEKKVACSPGFFGSVWFHFGSVRWRSRDNQASETRGNSKLG